MNFAKFHLAYPLFFSWELGCSFGSAIKQNCDEIYYLGVDFSTKKFRILGAEKDRTKKTWVVRRTDCQIWICCCNSMFFNLDILTNMTQDSGSYGHVLCEGFLDLLCLVGIQTYNPLDH